MRGIEGRNIFEEFKVHFCKLPCEIHTCRNHDMVGLVMGGETLEAFNVDVRITLNGKELILILGKDLGLFDIPSPLIHTTWCII